MSLLGRLRRRLRPTPEGPVAHPIGDVTITLPSGHALPRFQAAFPLYDRFLLAVGAQAIDGWILDIGANVGDSAAALVSGPLKKLLCIEPHAPFLEAMQANLPAITGNGSHVVLASEAISRSAGTVTLAANSSTATRGSSDLPEGHQTLTLDAVVARHCGDSPVSFIKCDVDGFDGDALLSGKGTIARDKPPVFFECVVSQHNISDYRELFDFFSGLGYIFQIFDNFGLPLVQADGQTQYANILEYLANMSDKKSAQTFDYVDCLAYPIDSILATAALKAFRAEFGL